MISPKDIRFAVIGGGNGGVSMAGYLAMKGYLVNLYNRTRENIEALIQNPLVRLDGAVEGVGHLNLVTDDMREALRDTDIVMVTVPSTGHNHVARAMAPHLRDGQIIVLNPGRTGGALEVYEILKRHGCNKNVVVAEAQTFIYACRTTGPNSAKIFSVKNEVKLAAIPSKYTNIVLHLLSDAYPQFVPAGDVIETSLNNFGAIFHPAPTLMNSGHIERGETFQYYLEGITPSIGQMLDTLDAERMKVAKALGIKTQSALEWLDEAYGAKGRNIYEAIQNNTAYKGLSAPKGLDTRYIYEDVPCSLVPISSMGKAMGIDTPAIDTIIKLADIITGRNFFSEGRTVEKLGLSGLSVAQIHMFARTGEIPAVSEEVVA